MVIRGLVLLWVAACAGGRPSTTPRLVDSDACVREGEWVRVSPMWPETPPVLVVDWFTGHTTKHHQTMVWEDGVVIVDSDQGWRAGTITTFERDAWLAQVRALEPMPAMTDLHVNHFISGAATTRIAVRDGRRWLVRDVVGAWLEDLLRPPGELAPEPEPEPTLDPEPASGSARGPFEGLLDDLVMLPPPPAVATLFADLYWRSAPWVNVRLSDKRMPARSIASFEVPVAPVYRDMAKQAIGWPVELVEPQGDALAVCADGYCTYSYAPSANTALAVLRRQLDVEPRPPVVLGHRRYAVGVIPMWEGERTYRRAGDCLLREK